MISDRDEAQLLLFQMEDNDGGASTDSDGDMEDIDTGIWSYAHIW